MDDWSKVKSALTTAAPWIAGTLGTPAAGVAVQALESVFGLAPGTATPDNLSAAIAGATPQQLADLRAAELKHIETMKQMRYRFQTSLRQADSADLASVNATMQAESNNSASESWYQKGWRPFNGFTFGIVLFLNYGLPTLINTFAPMFVHPWTAVVSQPIPEIVFAAWGGVLGVTAWHRGVMQVKQAAAGQGNG